jgi:hypothetical protein
MTRTQKILIAFVVVTAVFAVTVSPITVAFAQEPPDGNKLQSHSDAKTFEGKDAKSCSGKNKGGMST